MKILKESNFNSRCALDCEYFRKNVMKRRKIGLIIMFACIVFIFFLIGYMILKNNLDIELIEILKLYPNSIFIYSISGIMIYIIFEFLLYLILCINDFFRIKKSSGT